MDVDLDGEIVYRTIQVFLFFGKTDEGGCRGRRFQKSVEKLAKDKDREQEIENFRLRMSTLC